MKSRYTTAGLAIKDKKVFVAKRINEGALAEKWEFPGGKNREGESLEETLKREFLEELDVEINVKEEIFQTEFDNKDTHYTLKAFLIELLSCDFKLSVHTECRFVNKEELRKLDFGRSDSKIASYLLENNFLEE